MNLKVNGNAPEPYKNEPHSGRSPMSLINEISRLMGDRIRQTGDGNPISQKSGRLLLMELAKKDGRTQLDLVNATHLKAPTISVALQKLEHEGIVLRKPDDYDLRATRVFLTEKGRELDYHIRKHITEEESLAMVNLTETEMETLTAILEKIKRNLVKEMEEGEFY